MTNSEPTDGKHEDWHSVPAPKVEGWGEPSWSVTTPADPTAEHWMKRVVMTQPDEWRPGDVMIFGFDHQPTGDPDARYGHVEIITRQQARHYRRQTWKARLRVFFGGKP
jgi:hypothetical protein